MKQENLDLGVEYKEHLEEQKRVKNEMVYKAINIAMNVISDKALLFIVTLISAFFFGFSLFDPQPMRLVTSCLFTGGVFLPILWRYMRKK